jgi:glycosyl-4,4'-diaponeurosporenoate acyltransferase
MVINLPIFWVILLDCLAWAIIQPSVAYLSMRFPASVLKSEQWLYRTRRWEAGGEIYNIVFHVKHWKWRLPYGGSLFQKDFSMKKIASNEEEYLRLWVKESCRSELCHWVAISPAVLFFVWNPFWMWIMMLVYAVIINTIPIIVQRYNRPRLLRILNSKVEKYSYKS